MLPVEGIEHGRSLGNGVFQAGLIVSVHHQRQQCFGETSEVPARDRRLVAVGVAALVIDAAEDGFGVIRFHEGAGAVVDGFAGERHVVGVHHAVDEAGVEPLGDQPGLAFGHGAQQGDVALGGVGLGGQRRVVAGDGVVGQAAQGVDVAAGGEELEGAHAQVAGGHTGEHGAGQRALAVDGLAGGGHGQRAGGGDAQRVHGLADEGFAQHRADGGLAITTAREGRAARAFESDVAALAVAVDQLAQQQRAAVSQLR